MRKLYKLVYKEDKYFYVSPKFWPKMHGKEVSRIKVESRQGCIFQYRGVKAEFREIMKLKSRETS